MHCQTGQNPEATCGVLTNSDAGVAVPPGLLRAKTKGARFSAFAVTGRLLFFILFS